MLKCTSASLWVFSLTVSAIDLISCRRHEQRSTISLSYPEQTSLCGGCERVSLLSEGLHHILCKITASQKQCVDSNDVSVIARESLFARCARQCLQAGLAISANVKPRVQLLISASVKPVVLLLISANVKPLVLLLISANVKPLVQLLISAKVSTRGPVRPEGLLSRGTRFFTRNCENNCTRTLLDCSKMFHCRAQVPQESWGSSFLQSVAVRQ